MPHVAVELGARRPFSPGRHRLDRPLAGSGGRRPAKPTQTESPSRAECARDALAAEQAKATAGDRDKGNLLRQLAELERSLGDEKGKAIRFEGKVEWLQEQVKEGERRAADLRQALSTTQAEAATARQEAKEAQASAAAEQARAAELERAKADLHRQLAALELRWARKRGGLASWKADWK